MSRVTKLTLVALLGALVVTGCGTKTDPPRSRHQQDVEHCLYVSTQMYPHLVDVTPHSYQPQLSQVPECRELPAADQAEIRLLVKDFVLAYEQSK